MDNEIRIFDAVRKVFGDRKSALKTKTSLGRETIDWDFAAASGWCQLLVAVGGVASIAIIGKVKVKV